MERVIKIDGHFGNKVKYALVKEIGYVGLYQEKTSNDYFVSQSYLIKRDDEDRVFVFESFNDFIYEEILDFIDLLNNKKPFKLRAFLRDGVYIIHPNGDLHI